MRNYITGRFMPAPGVREIDFGHCVIRLAEPIGAGKKRSPAAARIGFLFRRTKLRQIPPL